MREPDISLQCLPVEPDSVLLEQITMLATASVVPPATPWWQRAATKSGAAAVAGVLALSGTAYAERGELAPIVKSMTGHSSHHAARHRATHESAPVTPAVVAATAPTPSVGASDHGRRAHGFHAKRGRGAGWTKKSDNQSKGHAYGRRGIGKTAKHTKTGHRSATHSNHSGWLHPKGKALL